MTDDYAERIEKWRAARHRRLTAPDGWLAVVGKHPLREGENTVGGAEASDVRLPEGAPPRVCTIALSGARAVVRAEPDVEVTCNGQRFVEQELTPADVVRVGTLSLSLLWRGDTVSARIKDESSPARRSFSGIPSYPLDARWRIEARLERFDEEREVELDYEGGASTVYRSPGIAVFRVPDDARDHRLLVLYETDVPRIFVLFKDATNKDETYGAGRFLYAPLPEDDRVVLDFNTAFNPPCALTPWASCPLTPRENVLPVRVEAGEKRLAEH